MNLFLNNLALFLQRKQNIVNLKSVAPSFAHFQEPLIHFGVHYDSTDYA